MCTSGWNPCSQLGRANRGRSPAPHATPQSAEPTAAPALPRLPIRDVADAVLEALSTYAGVVVEAPPGAGKTTLLPLLLLARDPAWLHGEGQGDLRHLAATGGGVPVRPIILLTASLAVQGSASSCCSRAGKRIVVLQPRRLAAISTARRMAALLGERVGETVGNRVRGQCRVSRRTRIEVVTDGVLLRWLTGEAVAEGSTSRVDNDKTSSIGAVFLDEFHERGVTSDLCLTLLLHRMARQGALKGASEGAGGDGNEGSLQHSEATTKHPASSPRLCVMSATLGRGLSARVAAMVGEAAGAGPVPVVTSEGRPFPVRVRYAGSPGQGRGDLERAVAAAVTEVLRETGRGDVLVFLPGVGEIRRVATALGSLGQSVAVVLLHGDLSPGAQEAAIAPDESGETV